MLASGAIAVVAAHEGHSTVERPVYHEAHAGAGSYRVGLAMLPADAVVGEDVRIEVQLLELPASAEGAAPGRPLSGADVQIQVLPTAGEPYTLPHVGPGEKPGTYTARYRFGESGQYAIAVTAPVAGARVAAEFPIAVSAGPIPRTTLLLDAAILLVAGAWAAARLRGGGPRTAGAAIAVAGIAAVGLAHAFAGPRVGRLFLPERHFGTIGWDLGNPPADLQPAAAPADTPHVDPPGTPPHTHPPGTPPHTHPPGTPPHSHGGDEASAAAAIGSRDIVSTVTPAPGQLVDVMVPASARVLFDGFTPRVGASVRRGQTIATLEYSYVLHDAVHLINQRWLYLVPMLASRRTSLEAELAAARTRYLAAQGEPSVQQAMKVMHATETADLAAVTAAKDYERARKLLAMHSAEIAQSAPVRRPLAAPIDGVIEAVNFAHGELKYENDKLFTILDLTRVWVEVRFPDDPASRTPPKRMQFVSPAFPDARFEGRLVRVANTLDPRTGTLSAFFEVGNPQRLLRLGMRLVATAGATAPAGTAGSTAGAHAVPAAFVSAPPSSAAVPLIAAIQPAPELRAEVAAPLWGRIEFAHRRLAVGDTVKKGEDLAQVVLELAADERYQMNARLVDIRAESELSTARREQAEKRWSDAVAALQANPRDPFRKAEMALLDRIREAARDEETVLARQGDAYVETMKRRDPKITIVKAPISGVITEIGFRPGELNGTDEFRRLFTIVDTSRVWLRAPVYDEDAAAVIRGVRRASFTAPAFDGARRLGRPSAVSGAVDPETGALSVIFDVPNPDGALKIGGSGRITIERE